MQRLSRQLALSQRAFATTARQLEAGPAVPAKKAETAPQVTEGPAPTEVKQAPNRADIWAPSQRPRSKAMTGPRFEQTNYDLQVWRAHARLGKGSSSRETKGLTDPGLLAATICSDRAHPPAARPVDSRAGGGV